MVWNMIPSLTYRLYVFKRILKRLAVTIVDIGLTVGNCLFGVSRLTRGNSDYNPRLFEGCRILPGRMTLPGEAVKPTNILSWFEIDCNCRREGRITVELFGAYAKGLYTRFYTGSHSQTHKYTYTVCVCGVIYELITVYSNAKCSAHHWVYTRACTSQSRITNRGSC